MVSLLTGIVTSSVHVISGPDHLAAVTPLAIGAKLKAWLVGLIWGVGHVLGALLIGGLFLLFRELIPVELISNYSEQIVGFMLILIGVWALSRILGKKHKHIKDISGSKTLWSAISIGILHGLAGVSHLVGILPTLALPTRFDAALYLGGFVLGTILTMASYSFLLGLASHGAILKNKHTFYKRISAVGGLFAIVIGIYWIGITW